MSEIQIIEKLPTPAEYNFIRTSVKEEKSESGKT